jgi:hypothetical protein
LRNNGACAYVEFSLNSLLVVRAAVADGILKKRRQRLRAALFSCVYAVGVGFHSLRFSSVSSFHIADSSCE